MAETAARLREAAKPGLVRAFVPDTAKTEAGGAGMALRSLGPLMEIVAEIAPKGIQRKPAQTKGQE